MADLIAVLSSKAGIDPESARKGLGALLAFLKGRLDPEIYAKVHSAVPGADELIASYESGGGHGGLVGMVAEVAGKVLGGHAGEGADLLAKMSRSGLDAGQAQALLPHAVDLLQDHLPPHLLEQVKPFLAAASAPTAAAGTDSVPPADSPPAVATE